MSSPNLSSKETAKTDPPDLTLSNQEEQQIQQLQRRIKEYSTGGMVAGGAALSSLILLPAVSIPAMAIIAPIIGVGAAGVASWLLKSKLDKEKRLREILDKIQDSTRAADVASASDKNSVRAKAM